MNVKAARTEIEPNDNDRFSKRLKILGMGLLLLGVLAIAFPLVSSVAVETMLGVVVLLAGVFHIVHSFPCHKWSFCEFIWGGILVLGGTSLVSHPIHGLVALTILVGIIFVAEGASKVLLGLFYIPRHKAIFVFDGAIGVAIGAFILLKLPGDALWIVGTLVGIRFLAAGVVTFSLSSSVKQTISG